MLDTDYYGIHENLKDNFEKLGILINVC
jgi:hypothetical protein